MVVGSALATAIAVGSLAVAGATAQTSSDDPTPATVLTGAVSALGAPVGSPATWESTHLTTGRYELRFADELRLEIRSWDAAADVAYRSTRPGIWVVDFTAGQEAVDTPFSFRAVPHSP